MTQEKETKLFEIFLSYFEQALIENPDNYICHAAEYFTRLSNEQPKLEETDEGSKEQTEQTLWGRNKRRATIVGEAFNPEAASDLKYYIEVIPKTDEDRKRIMEACEEISIFRTLHKNNLDAIIDVMEGRFVKKGAVIIKQGDDGDYLYLIERGKFKAYITDEEGTDNFLKMYENRGVFGELSLLYLSVLYNLEGVVTVMAESEGFLWTLPRKIFNALIRSRPFSKRKMYMELYNGDPERESLTKYEKMQVADALEGKRYSSEENIVTERYESDGMPVIVDGKVSETQKSDLDEDEGVAYFAGAEELDSGEIIAAQAFEIDNPSDEELDDIGHAGSSGLAEDGNEKLECKRFLSLLSQWSHKDQANVHEIQEYLRSKNVNTTIPRIRFLLYIASHNKRLRKFM